MGCPFGFTKQEEGSIHLSVENDNSESLNVEDWNKIEGSDASSDVSNQEEEEVSDGEDGAEKFDAGLEWLKNNNIKDEQAFEKVRDNLKVEARKRLKLLKNKSKHFAGILSDSELESLSLRSSDWSDLNSRPDTLASLNTQAIGWVEKFQFGFPAASTVKFTSVITMVTLGFNLYKLAKAVSNIRKFSGVVLNGWLSTASLMVVVVAVLFTLLQWLSAAFLSKRILLTAQCGHVITYAAAVAVLLLTNILPMGVDSRLQEAACSRLSGQPQSRGSKLCEMLPEIQGAVAAQGGRLRTALSICIFCPVVLLGTGLWLAHEIGYLEKKGIKQRRRNSRKVHNIPWSKLRVEEIDAWRVEAAKDAEAGAEEGPEEEEEEVSQAEEGGKAEPQKKDKGRGKSTRSSTKEVEAAEVNGGEEEEQEREEEEARMEGDSEDEVPREEVVAKQASDEEEEEEEEEETAEFEAESEGEIEAAEERDAAEEEEEEGEGAPQLRERRRRSGAREDGHGKKGELGGDTAEDGNDGDVDEDEVVAGKGKSEAAAEKGEKAGEPKNRQEKKND